ncbi:MAG: hypothetical protein U1G07_00470 [Verrucomicrobiota bacterium]
MSHESTTVFLWNDSHLEKTMVAASASSDSVEVYYALENRCSRHGGSCTVASHVWYASAGRYLVEELVPLD